MSEVWLPAASVTISLFLVIIFFTKKNFKNDEVKIYKYMLILNLLFSINAFNTYLIAKMFDANLLVSIMLRMHLGMLFLISYLFFRYILLVNNLNKKIVTLIVKFTNVVTFVIFLLIFLSPINVINYDSILDVSGFSYTITIIGVIFYYLLMVLFNIRYIFKYKDNHKKHVFFLVLSFLFIVGLVLRIYFPEIISETYCVSFIFLVMYFTIENPDYLMIEKLEIATEEALKANQAKTDFLSSISHEVRTPLNAIVGFSNCIGSSKTLDEAKENAIDIVNASNALLDIVNGVLDISKIESGKLDIVNSNYNPREKFLGLANLMKNRMTEKGLDFRVNIASDLPSNLYGDHVNLRKVVINLLSNACKYTDKGYVKYEVNCVNKGDVCRLIISVEDSGRGIKKENVSKLFTKFQRLDEDRNTTIEGTGLGLAITKRIVDLMGGKIIVHTVYGEGSKFSVVINQKIDLSGNSNNSINYDMYNDNKHFSLKNRKILVVDDNNLNLKVTSKILERYHANVVVMDSGFKCIESIKNGDYYDLILMDDMMPQMSGVMTLHKLKEIEFFDIPVVVLTANAISGMRDKYINDGFDEYLSKPIDKHELKRVLRGIFNHDKLEKKVDFGSLPSEIYDIGINSSGKKTQEIEELDMEEDSDFGVKYLEDNNVDLKYAISLLGDIDMYNDTLKDFIFDVDDKYRKVCEYLKNGDMKNYSILVHSLKSDAKYLGFMDFSNICYQHELKSKENDYLYVHNNFSLLEKELKRIINISNEYLKHI